jgi:anaerobic ribonucleoside-triphosphate reductase
VDSYKGNHSVFEIIMSYQYKSVICTMIDSDVFDMISGNGNFSKATCSRNKMIYNHHGKMYLITLRSVSKYKKSLNLVGKKLKSNWDSLKLKKILFNMMIIAQVLAVKTSP